MPEEQEHVKKLIKVDFTQDELLELGMKLTEQIREARNLEKLKAAASADFASRIKQTNLQIDDTGKKIDDGWELRHEECLIEYDYNLNMVHYIFEHNGQRIVVEQRKMTSDEKQIGIDFESSDESSTRLSPADNIFDTVAAPGFD